MYPFTCIHQGGERHCECKVSGPRPQRYSSPWLGLEPGLLDLEFSTLATMPPLLSKVMILFMCLFNQLCYRENDVAGIDVNMGCPKDYSVKVKKIILADNVPTYMYACHTVWEIITFKKFL